MTDDPAGGEPAAEEPGADEMSSATDGGTETTTGEGSPATGDGLSLDGQRMVGVLTYGALGLLVVVSLVAFVGLYTSIGSVIDIWVTDRYQPVFRAAFNLVVLLLAGVGISVLVRRLR